MAEVMKFADFKELGSEAAVKVRNLYQIFSNPVVRECHI